MTTSRIVSLGGCLAFILLGGCGSLSGAGPSGAQMQQSADVDMVQVTPALAREQASNFERIEADRIAHTLLNLRKPADAPPMIISPGTRLAVTLWSYSGRPGANGPSATPLGNFVVAADGTISLPYLKTIALSGITVPAAQELIAGRYTALSIFQEPSILLDVTAAPGGQILVTGAIGQPRTLPWPPGGITLAEALTQALGDGAALLGQEGDSTTRPAATRVSVFRTGEAASELPVAVALNEVIPLKPGDRIVVSKAPAVEVTVLGPGLQSNGIYAFGHVPTLSEAMARGSGLNANTANDRAVFVMRQRSGQKPVLYDFAWNRAQGMVAAHGFPMHDGDLIYVAEAPIVPVQRVINLLFQVALPAQLVK